jgi:tRNA dimethylallyltransferase
MKSPKYVIAVVGPTATGKTDVGVHIAKRLETEIVSADSRLVFQELNIGTAKPTLEERQGIPHHLMDMVSPAEVYSAARYQEDAMAILQDLWNKGKTPVVVGGTGFYIRALLEASFIPPVPPNEGFRDEMAVVAQEKGASYLHELLQKKDPNRAAALHPNDLFRIIRALEIIQALGGPVPNVEKEKDLEITWIGLTVEDRDYLRKKIDRRIDLMLEMGWLEEVEGLLQKYGPEAEALQITHGYPELVNVLQERWTLEEALADIQIQIHQYARRQITWFKRNKAIQWFPIDCLAPAELYQQITESMGF